MKSYFFSTIMAATFGVLLTYGAINILTATFSRTQAASPILASQLLVVPPPRPVVVLVPPIVTLNFVGDIMLDRGVYSSVQKNGAGDFNWLFAAVSNLAESDILLGNLEGPLSDQGSKMGSIYSFRMKPVAAAALAVAGFDVLALANNHIGDWGRAAMLDTVSRLTNAGIMPVGVGVNWPEAARPQIIEKNGLKIGFLSVSDVGPNWLAAGNDQSGIILASDKHLPEIIREAAAQVDQLVVTFHFGEEYQKRATDRQKYLAHLAIDNGARLVVGTHPHVVEEVERYGGGLVAYSLGNFIFDQNFSAETMQGLVLEVTLDQSGIKSASTRESYQDASFQPHLSLESTNVQFLAAIASSLLRSGAAG